ncbi:hypothetical protein WME95_40405 [Sorangium sp. So ce327]|uniref:hypothetical protein n=1 Tax=Sorangium sp. So ce327 TaxID=3133301 RepID=UPI003F5F25CD
MNIVDLGVVARQIESMIGTRLPSIVPGAIDDALGTLQWTRIPTGIEDDDTMAKLLGLSSLSPDTELVVVTDVSFKEGSGAFAISASQFEEFQAWYSDQFSERVFSGCDVIICAPVDRRLWIVHHEGVYATAQLRAPDKSQSGRN